MEYHRSFVTDRRVHSNESVTTSKRFRHLTLGGGNRRIQTGGRTKRPGQRGGWVDRENDRLTRWLVEVEVEGEIAEDARVLTNVHSRVRASVGSWVEPLTIEKVILNELVIGVEGQGLMVDKPSPGIGTDDDPGNAQAVPVGVDARWHHVVVESTPVIPGKEDRRG